MIMLALCGYVKHGSSLEGDTSLARAPRTLPSTLNGHILRLHEFPSGPVYRSSPNLSVTRRSGMLIRNRPLGAQRQVECSPSLGRAVEKLESCLVHRATGQCMTTDPGDRWLRSISRDFTHR